MQYRAEIDGLRTLAVIPVILFHAGVPFLRGGFVGVDVFFVISGFLITSIIAKDLDEGHFTVKRFYDRRLRRILPALFFVLVCCLPFAWMWMLPEEFSSFSGSLISAILSVSNIFFYKNIDYFSASAENMPLLHTWSLGVEEQFYVVFPLILMALWRFGRRRVFITVLSVSAVSLAWGEYSQGRNAMASFFLLPSRAWELGAGALAALWLARREPPKSELGALAGIAMIGISVFVYTEKTPFPSVYTLLPVVGTVLVLLFAVKGTLVHKLLAWRPMVGIGLISYSAYLWHPALICICKNSCSRAPAPLDISFLVTGVLDSCLS